MFYIWNVPISSLGFWFFGGSAFWVPCRFWVLVLIRWIVGKDFIPFCELSLEFSNYFFFVQKFFSAMQSHLFIISLRCWAFWVLLRNLFPIPVCSSVFTTTSCSCFKISGLILKSLIHFELILVQGERQGSNFGLLHVHIQFSQQHLLKRLSFLFLFLFLVLLCWMGGGYLFSTVCFGLLCWRAVGCRFMSGSFILIHWSSWLFVAILCCFYCKSLFSVVWSQVLWYFQHWTCIGSELLWLLDVFRVFVCVLGLTFLSLWRMSLEFW
jgi:hypothetical protein